VIWEDVEGEAMVHGFGLDGKLAKLPTVLDVTVPAARTAGR
jgi:hypothetical protein